jgi:hypothetical protein
VMTNAPFLVPTSTRTELIPTLLDVGSIGA